jgi:hypothetical protein
MNVVLELPNLANDEVYLTHLVGGVLGLEFSYWAPDAPDIEVDPPEHATRGRPKGNIKPDGSLVVGPNEFAVVEVETTTEPIGWVGGLVVTLGIGLSTFR